jgi:hypothetical protein
VVNPRRDDLVADPEFLLATDPDRMLDAVVEPEAVRVASAFRLAAAYLKDEPAEAASHLQLAARRVGADQLADRIGYRGGLTWHTHWLLPAQEDRQRTPGAGTCWHLGPSTPPAARTAWQEALAILTDLGHPMSNVYVADCLSPSRTPDQIVEPSGVYGKHMSTRDAFARMGGVHPRTRQIDLGVIWPAVFR